MDLRYAERMSHLKASEIREILKVTQNPEVISFAGGLPAPGLFPVKEIETACDRARPLSSTPPRKDMILSANGSSAVTTNGTERSSIRTTCL